MESLDEELLSHLPRPAWNYLSSKLPASDSNKMNDLVANEDDRLLPKNVYGDAAYKQAFFLLSYRRGTDFLVFLGGGRLKPENGQVL